MNIYSYIAGLFCVFFFGLVTGASSAHYGIIFGYIGLLISIVLLIVAIIKDLVK